MTSVLPEIAGYLTIIAALYILVRINERPRKPSVAELVADARIESALLDGEDDAAMAAACAAETRTQLVPLSDSEVARRIRKQMDENAAVRQLRADIENWETA